MKKQITFCCFVLFLLGAFQIQEACGQQTVDIGPTTGSSNYFYGPYYRSSSSSSFDYSTYAYLYTAAELNIPPGALITKVSWLKASGTISGNNTFKIRMDNSSATTLSSTSYGTLMSTGTQVYSSTTRSFTAGNDSYEEFAFSTPFLYTGGSLEIITDHAMTGTPSAANDYYYETATGMAIGRASGSAPTGSTTIGSSSSYNNHRPTIRITYRLTAGNNAGISELSSPLNFCPGTEAIKVKVLNAGINVIDSVKIGWTLDGVAQTPYSLTQPLDTFGGSGVIEREVTLGSHTFTTAPVNFKAWTYLPNGVADTSNSNDTISLVLHSSLSGTFTIDAGSAASATNYQSFEDFIDDLEQYGVCGPVTANVVSGSGPYNETVTIGAIAGVSAVNTIRINGNGETVQYSNTTSNRQLLTLDGAQYIILDSLKFKAMATGYGWGALITNGSAYDSIMRCEFDLSSVTSTSSVNSIGIAFSASTTSATSTGGNGSHCYLGYNYVKGSTGSGSCYYGITVAGASDSNIIEHNRITNFRTYGIYINGATGTQILHNDVNRATKTSVSTFYGIYLTGVTPGTQIIGNRLHAPGGTNGGTSSCYGMRLYGDGESTNPVLVANNAVYDLNQGGSIYGVYLSTAPHCLVYNNTINIDQTLSSSSTNYGIYASGTNTGTEIKNNNVSITAGGTGTKYGFYYSSSSSIDDAQKNNFYVNSSQSGTQHYGYYSGAFATLAAFQAANPTLEVGSPADDPQFANAAIGDLTPQSTALLGQGVDLTAIVPEDINGNLRPATPAIGAFEKPPAGSNNAGAQSFISPEGNFCADSQMVKVTVYNAGVNNITSVQVNWSVNGVTQTPVAYTGTLVPLTSTSGQSSDTVALGNVYFPSTTATDIIVWTSLPNGVADTVTTGDTISTSIQATAYMATAASDTLCSGSNAVLNLDPDNGYNAGDLMWQTSPDGSVWTDVANSDDVTYTDSTVINNTWYRVQIGGASGCNSDSVKVTVVDANILSTTPGSNCGPGSVSLSATGTAGTTINWYDDPLATAPLDTGSVFNTPSLTSTDTFYASSIFNGIGGSGVRITEMNVGTSPDAIEIQNVGNSPVDVTGWKVAVSNSYTSITDVNSIVKTLNGVMNPGDIKYWTDNSSNHYWGSNFLFNPNEGGWVIVLDNNDNIVDFVAQDWSATTIQSTTLTISGSSVSLSGAWVGAGLGSGNAFSRQGSTDNDDASDFQSGSSGSLGTTNSGLTLPFGGLGGGCESARIPVIATILSKPNVALGNDTVFCSSGSQTLMLDAGNPGMAYLWSTGDTTQTISTSLSVSDYSVVVTAANGCMAADTINVTSGIMPTLVLPAQVDLCSGNDTTLDAGNPGGSYSWSTGDTSQAITVQSGGSYQVEITSPTGCTLMDTVDVNILTTPVVDLGTDTIFCAGDTLRLDAGNAGATFDWNTNATTSSISITSGGNYYVLVTAPNGCFTSDTIQVETAFLPVQTLPSALYLCEGDTMMLDAGNSGSSFDWSTGDSSQTIDVYLGGNYSVTVTNTSGCSIDMTIQVTSIPLPVIDLGQDTGFCRGSGMTLYAGNTGSHFSWNTGDTTQTISVTDSGTYTVIVTSEPYGCANSDSIHLAFNPLPNIVGITGTIQNDDSYTFTATGVTDATSYLWDFGDGDTSSAVSPNHTFPASGNYTVVLTVTNDCGSDTSSVNIEYIAMGIGNLDMEESQLLLYPNPARDMIMLKNESKHQMRSIIVYNVLGQVIFSAKTDNPLMYRLDTRKLASGVYNVKVIMKDGHRVQRRFEILK